jgi:hypothetical protein
MGLRVVGSERANKKFIEGTKFDILEKIFKKLREKNNGFDIGYPKIYHKLGGK